MSLTESGHGGMFAWTRMNLCMAFEVWQGKDVGEQVFLLAQRKWVLLETKNKKVTVCGLYCRVNDNVNSEKYQQNEALFALLDQEKLELENQGYGVVIIGDYNVSRSQISFTLIIILILSMGKTDGPIKEILEIIMLHP